MEHNFERLKAHILPLSEAQDFETARTEWRLVGVDISAKVKNCPCGQGILEHCSIENTRTGQRTYVGNVCISRFMGIDTGNLFDGLRRIEEDEFANANSDVIEYAYERGFIFESEYKFLTKTRRNRFLSPKQREWKRKINGRIIKQTVVQKGNAR